MAEFNGTVNLTNQSSNSSAFPDWASFDPQTVMDDAGGLWKLFEGWIYNTLGSWGYDPFHVTFMLLVVVIGGLAVAYFFMQGSSKSSGGIIGLIKFVIIIAVALVFLGVI